MESTSESDTDEMEGRRKDRARRWSDSYEKHAANGGTGKEQTDEQQERRIDR